MRELTINTALLKYYMELKQVDKTGLANKAEISRNTVSALFSGKDVSMRTVQKVIYALDIPVGAAGQIFFGEKLHSA